jgi:hypothetical protein
MITNKFNYKLLRKVIEENGNIGSFMIEKMKRLY